MSVHYARYPDKKREYSRSTGRILPRILGTIFEELGFTVKVTRGQGNGVDLKVFDAKGNLILVAEILNWSLFTWLATGRKDDIITNLSEYDCRKTLIYTAMANEKKLNDLFLYEIFLVKIGYQVLSQADYNHFSGKNEIVRRRIDSEETEEYIKSKIVKFLQSSGIEIPRKINNPLQMQTAHKTLDDFVMIT